MSAKTARSIWVQNNVSCVRDAADRPLHIITLTEDVTERHLVAEALEQRVQERTRELSARPGGRPRSRLEPGARAGPGADPRSAPEGGGAQQRGHLFM